MSLAVSRGLNVAVPLLFESSLPGLCGTRSAPHRFDEAAYDGRLGGLHRCDTIGLPELSEPQVMRHFVTLSAKNYCIDTGIYPLGSCSMKYNPRVNEKVARLDGLANIHPNQPEGTVQGILQIMYELGEALKAITGMADITLTPAAGAHGELTGLMAIKKALSEREERGRNIIIVPESAHGTNPASAVMCGFKVVSVQANKEGTVDMDVFKAILEKYEGKVAGMMLTNPNTLGIFEGEIKNMADLIHEQGGYFYMDGANLNALMGNALVDDFGVDAMHINIHKTFSTPHGGGGPGGGPVVFSELLAPYCPIPKVVKNPDGSYHLMDEADAPDTTLGRVKGFAGQVGLMVRALAYIKAMGAEGLTQASRDAILNANYLQHELTEGGLTAPFEGPNMHEFVLSDHYLKGTSVTTMDMAKGLLDAGHHPPTVYFPLVVSGAMLIEPTESEPLTSLDRFAGDLIGLADKAHGCQDDTCEMKSSPTLTPVRRCDEVGAAKNPVLRWVKPRGVDL
ncbi:Glycine cleavage system P-protein P2 subunit [Carpediemonas membranifera]|uniref:glycine dehydrogenase (aminomethyl-transferring) n=1 Tax=Carpediemonas membranifera TaxID=201153 RepID=A0A8J6B8U8_9EUKA|nr:Glycine cleavage system P-protein P2 subunit [Carpediemonas membranifera]|eukprot:KAG9392397.1 Glycine cleavage system P-protein P2 subunit [Carpediemonas membranifera]